MEVSFPRGELKEVEEPARDSEDSEEFRSEREEAEAEDRFGLRIKHKSLILAQDERWRRA